MLLAIHNLPCNTTYPIIKQLIFRRCGLKDILLDELVDEGNTKKATIGVVHQADAAILFRKINGLYLDGQSLYVEDLRKNTEQPYRPTSAAGEFGSFPGVLSSSVDCGPTNQYHSPTVNRPLRMQNYNMPEDAMPSKVNPATDRYHSQNETFSSYQDHYSGRNEKVFESSQNRDSYSNDERLEYARNSGIPSGPIEDNNFMRENDPLKRPFFHDLRNPQASLSENNAREYFGQQEIYDSGRTTSYQYESEMINEHVRPCDKYAMSDSSQLGFRKDINVQKRPFSSNRNRTDERDPGKGFRANEISGNRNYISNFEAGNTFRRGKISESGNFRPDYNDVKETYISQGSRIHTIQELNYDEGSRVYKYIKSGSNIDRGSIDRDSSFERDHFEYRRFGASQTTNKEIPKKNVLYSHESVPYSKSFGIQADKSTQRKRSAYTESYERPVEIKKKKPSDVSFATGFKPHKNKGALGASSASKIQKDVTWRGQAAAAIAKSIAQTFNVDWSEAEKHVFQALKLSIRWRIDVAMVNQFALPVRKIIMLYREKFPPYTDKSLLDTIKAKHNSVKLPRDVNGAFSGNEGINPNSSDSIANDTLIVKSKQRKQKVLKEQVCSNKEEVLKAQHVLKNETKTKPISTFKRQLPSTKGGLTHSIGAGSTPAEFRTSTSPSTLIQPNFNHRGEVDAQTAPAPARKQLVAAKRTRLDDSISPRGVTKRAKTDPRSRAPVSYANAIQSQLQVAIITVPPCNFTQEQAEQLRMTIDDSILEAACSLTTPPNPAPSFRGRPFLMDGALAMWCENHYALDWLRTHIGSMQSPVMGTSLAVIRQAELKKKVRAGLQLMTRISDPVVLQRVLCNQNPWYKVDSWQLYRMEEIVEEDAVEARERTIFLTLGIPKDQVNSILKRDRRVSFTSGCGYLRFFKPAGVPLTDAATHNPATASSGPPSLGAEQATSSNVRPSLSGKLSDANVDLSDGDLSLDKEKWLRSS